MKRPPKPHPSHKMTVWKSDIITVTCTPRFGTIRKCKKCLAEQAHTVTGYHTFPILLKKCLYK